MRLIPRRVRLVWFAYLGALMGANGGSHRRELTMAQRASVGA